MRPFLLLTLGLLIGCAAGHLPDDGGRQPEDASVPPRDADSSCAALDCDDNARCDTATGAPRCVCNDGYAGTGQVCNDIDECAVDPTRCAPNECINLPGSFACDECPDDPDKIAPGVCGCGVPDTDRDADGTYDCIDGCPDDPAKNEPGACGCGMPETDSDGDGAPDCVDGCPDDPLKTEPGVCGCGSPEPSGGTSSTIGEPRNANYTEGPFFRGNVYLASSTTTLASFEQYLGLPSSCSLGFHVARGSSASGPWTPLWSVRRPASGSGYHSSGPIDIMLSAGSHYMLGVGWSCTNVGYGGSNSGWSGHSTVVGAYQGNVWDNAYPGHSTGYRPPGTGTAMLAYAQRIHASGVCR